MTFAQRLANTIGEPYAGAEPQQKRCVPWWYRAARRSAEILAAQEEEPAMTGYEADWLKEQAPGHAARGRPLWP